MYIHIIYKKKKKKLTLDDTNKHSISISGVLHPTNVVGRPSISALS